MQTKQKAEGRPAGTLGRLKYCGCGQVSYTGKTWFTLSKRVVLALPRLGATAGVCPSCRAAEQPAAQQSA
mgnify:CR=1 FL=1